jgi:N utilization substance protein A
MSNIANAEILQIADAVSREKGIPREVLISSMEQAIQVAGRRKYGHEHNIRADINKKTGEIRLYKVTTVVEIVENDITEISLADELSHNCLLYTSDAADDM